jgi:protein O-mannosyl-transferase
MKKIFISIIYKLKNKYLNYLILSCIIIITLIIYSNSIKNDFTNWDDNVFVTDNPDIRELSLENIRNMFTHTYEYMYVPVSVFTFAIEYKFFGLNPLPYHADNLILHLLNIILVFYFIYLLTNPQTSNNRLTISAIVALFFGIHPMHVESVAWVAERKDVLYSFFFLAGLITYIRSKRSEVRSQKNKYLIFTYILFILSLLSKSAAVCFPVVLILIDYFTGSWKPEAGSWKYAMNKLPFFIIAMIIGIIAIYFQNIDHIPIAYSNIILDRILVVTYAASFYIVKLFIPTGLCALHYYPVKTGGLLPIEYYISAVFILCIVISIILIKPSQLKKNILFGSLFYFVTIMLEIRIIYARGAFITAERFSYLPYIGLVFALGNTFIRLRLGLILRQFLIGVMVIIVIIFSYMTYERNKVWFNTLTLFNDVSKKNPQKLYVPKRDSTNYTSKDITGAEKEFNPKDAQGYIERGNAKNITGNFKEAIQDYNKAIEINPAFDKAYYNRGIAKASLGDMPGAIKDFNISIAINPKYDEALNNRGNAKASLRDVSGAINDFKRATEINPQNADAFNNLGIVMILTGDHRRAIEEFSKAIVLNPKYTEAFFNRGNSRFRLGDKQGACSDWGKAAGLGKKKAYDLINENCK